MDRYILLRNNKEQGPYSREQLLEMGLKSYDLLWIEGKSAAWRYPSEINFFKDTVPATKQISETTLPKQQIEPIPAISPCLPAALHSDHQRFIPATARQNDKVPEMRKSVFVTLPKTKGPVEPSPTPVKKILPIYEKPALEQDAPEKPEIKYSQPLDEIKQEYVKRLYERRDTRKKKKQLTVVIKIAAAVLLLIGLGSVGGYFLYPAVSNNGAEKEQLPDQPFTTKTTKKTDEALQTAIINEQESGGNKQGFAKKELPGGVKKTVSQKKQAIADDKASTPVYEPEHTETVSGERKKTYRIQKKDTEPLIISKRPGWHDQVKVSSNDYTKVAFGGIRNLQLTVVNRSGYLLDDVIVELRYIKPSEQTLRTENIHFRNINADEAMTLKIPDTNRGIKVSYQITGITSSQAGDLAGK